MSRWRRIVLATLLAATVPPLAAAQEMLRYFDLKSDEFTKADMTRIEVEAVLAAANPARPADLSARRLNGLDLSGLDFRRAKLQATRLNGANLAGANLDGTTLDQAWALDADLTGATLRGASLFATQLIGAKLDGADLSDARITGDLTRASMTRARLDRADLSADMLTLPPSFIQLGLESGRQVQSEQPTKARSRRVAQRLGPVAVRVEQRARPA